MLGGWVLGGFDVGETVGGGLTVATVGFAVVGRGVGATAMTGVVGIRVVDVVGGVETSGANVGLVGSSPADGDGIVGSSPPGTPVGETTGGPVDSVLRLFGTGGSSPPRSNTSATPTPIATNTSRTAAQPTM